MREWKRVRHRYKEKDTEVKNERLDTRSVDEESDRNRANEKELETERKRYSSEEWILDICKNQMIEELSWCVRIYDRSIG